MKENRKLIIFTDCGDTIIDEGTEIRKVEGGVVYQADTIPGAKETYLKLYEEGYDIVLVADGLKESFDRMMKQHQMDHIFKAEAISEIVGANRFGIRSVLLTWAPRRRMTPESAEEQPTYIIRKPEELLGVVRQAEEELQKGEV